MTELRATATDTLENRGIPSPTTRFSISKIEQTNRSITYRRAWRKRVDVRDLAGSAAATSTAGASAKLTFTGSRVAVIMNAVRRGAATVYINGKRAGKVTNRGGGKPRTSCFTWTWSDSRHHTVKVVNAAGSTIELDAFLVIR